MFSKDIALKLKQLSEEHNLSNVAKLEFMNLLMNAYNEGLDYGIIRHSNETVPLGELSDMTLQELVNLLGVNK